MEDTSRRPSKAARTRKPSSTDASSPDVVMVPIVITADHVYLPLDSEGNGRADWRDTAATARVGKRARLGVPSDLARFLSDRDQAEILLRSGGASQDRSSFAATSDDTSSEAPKGA